MFISKKFLNFEKKSIFLLLWDLVLNFIKNWLHHGKSSFIYWMDRKKFDFEDLCCWIWIINFGFRHFASHQPSSCLNFLFFPCFLGLPFIGLKFFVLLKKIWSFQLQKELLMAVNSLRDLKIFLKHCLIEYLGPLKKSFD
jgi:hypothetical protein